MGLFNLFSKDKNSNRKTSATSDNGMSGPTFLDGLTEPIANPKRLESNEWRRKLKSSSGQTTFRIKYFGQLHHEYSNLIVGTDDIPALIVAVAVSDGQEIVLFDGCKHGYNAMFCDNYSDEVNRKADEVYSLDGVEIFEVTISVFYGIDYDDEFGGDVDADGLIELIDGSKMEFETVKRNGFDVIQIFGATDKGEPTEIVSEELA